MAGDYRSKKEVAYLLVPAVGTNLIVCYEEFFHNNQTGRKVVDLGENVEKGQSSSLSDLLPSIHTSIAPTFKLLGNSLILGSMVRFSHIQMRKPG